MCACERVCVCAYMCVCVCVCTVSGYSAFQGKWGGLRASLPICILWTKCQLQEQLERRQGRDTAHMNAYTQYITYYIHTTLRYATQCMTLNTLFIPHSPSHTLTTELPTRPYHHGNTTTHVHGSTTSPYSTLHHMTMATTPTYPQAYAHTHLTCCSPWS